MGSRVLDGLGGTGVEAGPLAALRQGGGSNLNRDNKLPPVGFGE